MAEPTGLQVLTEAQKFLGDRYVYGAAGPSTFDCSGLVQYVYGKLGIRLPRTSEEQYAATTRISAGDLHEGDLVFSEMSSSGPGHVGIYAGYRPIPGPQGERFGLTQAMVLEAPHTGDVVKYLPLSQFGATSYGRVKGTAIAPVTQPGSDITSGIASLITFPKTMLDWFEQSTADAAKAIGWFDAFFRPSTYVRLGAGVLGTIFLIAGLATLLMAAKET